MQLENKTPPIEQVYKETGNGTEELVVDGRLVRFFQILVGIDQRQKRNEKHNRNSNSPN